MFIKITFCQFRYTEWGLSKLRFANFVIKNEVYQNYVLPISLYKLRFIKITFCQFRYTEWGLSKLRFIARSEPDGTRWRTVGEVNGKDVSGVGSQQPCTVRWNMVYPALLPTIKTRDKLASSTASRELRSKIRQFQHRRFHITLKYCWHSEFSCFPCYDIW